jgi:hypothetical protein
MNKQPYLRDNPPNRFTARSLGILIRLHTTMTTA